MTDITLGHGQNLNQIIAFKRVTSILESLETLVGNLVIMREPSTVFRRKGLRLENVVLGDEFILGHRDRVFNRVFQLAHVSRPIMQHQFSQRFGGQSFDFLFHLLAKFLQKALYQRDDVLFAFSQRRHANGDHVNSIKQIFSEESLFHLLFQIFVGSHNHPDVHLYRNVAADGIELPLL